MVRGGPEIGSTGFHEVPQSQRFHWREAAHRVKSHWSSKLSGALSKTEWFSAHLHCFDLLTCSDNAARNAGFFGKSDHIAA